MSGGNLYQDVYLRCHECGNVATIWRKKSRLKEPNHVKHLWCYRCKQVTAHIEIRGQ